MEEKIKVHGSPEKSVFGLVGADIFTDEEKFYIKSDNDTKNTGWREIPPTPTNTPTVSITPTKTPIVSRTPANSATPTPTKTPTVTPTLTPSKSPPNPTLTPSNTVTPTPSYRSTWCFNGWNFVSTTGTINVTIVGLTSGAIRYVTGLIVGTGNPGHPGTCGFDPVSDFGSPTPPYYGNNISFIVGENIQISNFNPVGSININGYYKIRGTIYYPVGLISTIYSLDCNLGVTPTPTPTPTSTPYRGSYNYSITSTGPGVANRIDGPNTGVITVGVSTMQLQAVENSDGAFAGWSVPEGVILSDPNSINPIASGFYVHTDVVITAVFIYRPPSDNKIVSGIADNLGRFDFTYQTYAGGPFESFYRTDYSPYQVIDDLGICAYALGAIYSGQVFLSGNSC